MKSARLFAAPSAWTLRLLACAAAALLIGLACEDSGEEPVDPADVVDSLADQLLLCSALKPCPFNYGCIGGVCFKTGDGSSGGGTGDDAGFAGTSWQGGTPKGAALLSSRAQPCAVPLGLAFDGISLWCADANGNVARRFSPSSSAQTATAILPSGGTIDIAASGNVNSIAVSSGDGSVWRVGYNAGSTKLFSSNNSPGISLMRSAGQLLTLENGQLTRHHPSSYQAIQATKLETTLGGCQYLAWSYDYVFRWCGTVGAGASRQQRIGVYAAITTPNANLVQELRPVLDATSNGGIDVYDSKLWLIGTGSGAGVGRLFEYQIQ